MNNTKKHIYGIENIETPHERRAVKKIADELETYLVERDAYLCFGFNINVEFDCVLMCKSGFIIGELKEWPYVVEGYENGEWSRVKKMGQLEIIPGDKNPIRQTQIQRSKLAAALADFSNSQSGDKNKNNKEYWSRKIKAGLVQCPDLKLSLNISKNNYPWWFADGLSEFIERLKRQLLIEGEIESRFNKEFLTSLGVIRNITAPLPKQFLDNQYSKNHSYIIQSGPGGGKTQRIATIIKNISTKGGDLSKIYAISYTNRARDVLQERTINQLDTIGVTSNVPQFGTIHQFAREIINATDSKLKTSVISDIDAIAIFKSISITNNNDMDYESTLALILKSDGKFIEWPSHESEKSWGIFRKTIHERSRQTFVTMLLDSIESLANYKPNLKTIFVDEFQDTNGLQIEMLRILGSQGIDIFAVGDEEQSIFSWAGAIPKPFDQFNSIFHDTKNEIMIENHRSGKKIVSLANILRSDGLEQKAMKDFDGELLWIPFLTLDSSASDIAKIIKASTSDTQTAVASYGDFAILARSNYELDFAEDALERYKIPYQRGVELKFVDSWRMTELLYGVAACDPNCDYQTIISELRHLLLRPIGEQLVNLLNNSYHLFQNTNNCQDAVLNFFKSCPDTKATQNGIQTLIKNKEIFNKSNRIEDIISAVWHELMPPFGFFDYLHFEIANRNIYHLKMLARNFSGTPLQFVHKIMNDDGIIIAPNNNVVKIATVHQAKGDEWPIVFILDGSTNAFPLPRSINPEEEQRLLYVAVSRAIKQLHIYYANPPGLGNRLKNAKIAFDEIYLTIKGS